MTMKTDYEGYVGTPKFVLKLNEGMRVSVKAYDDCDAPFAAITFHVGQKELASGYIENLAYAQAIADAFEKLNAEFGDDATGT